MPTISLETLVTLNQGPFDEMVRAGEQLDPANQNSCWKFTRCVWSCETALKQMYRASVLLAKEAESDAIEAQIWKQMVSYADGAIQTLARFEKIYPECGTPELYNLALDYRTAAQERFEASLSAKECQTNPAMARLFPQTS
ncbi:MAG TPA: hypothetical protein VGF13_19925 [Verrucomicrobiae bacterium]|jgi:hypothetical protein